VDVAFESAHMTPQSPQFDSVLMFVSQPSAYNALQFR
jgi:hypothetical protein